MISLVSTPVLGFDLVRHRQGDAIATVLLRALASGPNDLRIFAAARLRTSDAQRDAAWAEVRVAEGPRSFQGRSADSTDHPLTDVILQLRERLIVDLDDVLRLVEQDILAWCATGTVDSPDGLVELGVAQAAGEAFTDAIAAVWPHRLADANRRVLAAAFVAGGRELPWRDPSTGPHDAEVQRALSRLARLDEAGRTALRATVSVLRPPNTEWSAAMHEASWAALTTGRIRAAASAQLLAVRSFRSGGLDATDGAEGVWNMISGYLQATVVSDVLSNDVRDLLSTPWLRAIG